MGNNITILQNQTQILRKKEQNFENYLRKLQSNFKRFFSSDRGVLFFI
jgi:hypothetical protein